MNGKHTENDSLTYFDAIGI